MANEDDISTQTAASQAATATKPVEACFDEQHIAKYEGHLSPLTERIRARTFWDGYKSYVKGMFGGLFIGSGIGGTIGLIGGGIALAAGAITTWPLVAACVGVGAAYGMMKGSEEFGLIGMHAGASSTAVVEAGRQSERVLESKLRYWQRVSARLTGKENELAAIAPEAYEPVLPIGDANDKPGLGPHMAAATAPTSKLFHWKTALIGLAVGVAAGGLLAVGALALPAIAGPLALHIGIHSVAHLAPVAMAVCGLFGASFGIDRSMFRRTFDVTDHLFSGELTRHKEAPTLALGPTPSQIMGKGAPAHQHSSQPAPTFHGLQPQVNVQASLDTAPASPARKGFVERTGKHASAGDKAPDYWQKVEAGRKALATLDTHSAAMH